MIRRGLSVQYHAGLWEQQCGQCESTLLTLLLFLLGLCGPGVCFSLISRFWDFHKGVLSMLVSNKVLLPSVILANQTVCSRVWHLQNRPVAGLLSRDVVSGQRVESSGMTGSCAAHTPDLAVSHAASLHVVCRCHVEFHMLCGSSVNDPLR